MDNFMDKLAKRFNAGELIQANGEAEARENQRLKEKTEEYDQIMQEVRRLNLKTIEISEQISQMAACSIEQLESYALQAKAAEEEQQKEWAQKEQQREQQREQEQKEQEQKERGASALAEEMSTRMIEKLNRLEEATTDIDIALSNVAEKSGRAAEQYSQFIEKTGQMEQSMQRMLEKSNRLEESTTDVEAAVGQVTEKAGKMEKALVEVTDKTTQMEGAIQRVTEASDHMQSVLSAVEVSADRLQYETAESRRTMESAFGNLEQVLTEQMNGDAEGEERLAELKEQMSAISAAEQESAKQIKEMIVNIRLYLDEVQKHIEDYVHKEDVKVYRNVQAVLMEQLSAKVRDLSDRMDQLDEKLDKSKGTKGLLAVVILLSVISIALQVVGMLGLF